MSCRTLDKFTDETRGLPFLLQPKSRLVQCSMLELRAGNAISFNGRGSCAQHYLDTPEWSGADEDLVPVLQCLSGSASDATRPASHGAGPVRLRREYLGLKTSTCALRKGGNVAPSRLPVSRAEVTRKRRLGQTPSDPNSAAWRTIPCSRRAIGRGSMSARTLSTPEFDQLRSHKRDSHLCTSAKSFGRCGATMKRQL